jgi:signal transduction histidine kinase
MMKRQTLIIVLLVWSLSYLNTADAQTNNNYIILDGTHTFASGDDPAWTSLLFDDSKWHSIIVPGSWQSQGIKPVKGLGWYRIHFVAPPRLESNNVAVMLGRIGDADEVFLNGLKIGKEGIISSRYVEATKIERLYIIPPHLMRYGQPNLLAVRVMNTYLNGGFFDNNILLGDYNSLMIEKLNRERGNIIIEFCFFSCFVIFFIACMFFYFRGLKEKEYIYFWIFITFYSSLFILGSITFYNTGAKSPLIQQIINTLSTILPAGLILLLMSVYQEKLHLLTKIMIAGFLIVAVANNVFYDYTVRKYLYAAWKGLFIATALFLIIFAAKAYLRKAHESGPILLGITGLVLGFILESIGGVDLLQFTGFFLWDYSAGFFMFCIMYSLAARFNRIKNQLVSASVKILDAHEDERKRLSRELHDGIGQSLLSMKLKFKMLADTFGKNKPVDRESFNELIEDISNTIEEVRSISSDLRPSFLENLSLTDALNWHARKAMDKSGIEFSIKSEDKIEISTRLKDNIYRVYQEALSNIIRHSEASRVDITLRMRGKSLVLEIRDNGKGFDPLLSEKHGAGLGLYTMRERIELLGGLFRIKSSDKIGTTMYIEVPSE